MIKMKYSKDYLLDLRPHGGNTICLAIHPRSGKYPKQMRSDAINLITVPIVSRSVINLMKSLMLLRIGFSMLLSLQRLG